MPSIPLITGIGLATPLGNTLDKTWASLIGGVTIFNHSRVPEIEPSGAAHVDVLAKCVAREAVKQARLNDDALRESALIVGTSKGPADAWLEAFPAAHAPGSIFTYGLAQTATAVASDLRIGGPRLTLSAACSSGLHALLRGAMMIRAGEVKRAMIVAAESSLHPLFIASFQRLGVIPRAGRVCRPFDQKREGFLIGEAAAAVCLESSDCADESDSHIAIENFALAADATHLTSSDPCGVSLSRLIRKTIGNKNIDLIHAHGTGTIANDANELRMIESSIEQPLKPILYSHKAALGHTLGATGLVAVAINCLCHRKGIVPPNSNTFDPLPNSKVILSAEPQHRPIKTSIALAAGFGGALAGVRLRSVERM